MAGVRQTNNGGFGTLPLSVSFSSGILSGSIIVCAGSFADNATSVALSDGYSDAVTDSGQGLFLNSSTATYSWIKAFLNPTAGAITVGATYSGGTPSYGDMWIWEVTGMTNAVFDMVPTPATGAGTSATSNFTGTLSSSSEIAIGLGETAGAFSAEGSGWTGTINGVTSDLGEYEILSSNASLQSTGTVGSGGAAWTMWIATLMSSTVGVPYNLDISQPQLASILAQKRRSVGWTPYFDHRFRKRRSGLLVRRS